ncbi:hypothetical protein G4G27_20935 [Sphingomonas sp. So64.6b]|uniref:hypothetical protein n=1 Tax=Sphingomonas sp. So64.6b TaxID=2997354 RepID=UPI0016017E4E|nr:hypothetical protein [Sphingomonas sp. So64.6b]QNA86171.1 hypothetical protein G4G27_20935 [Sphingomonas sp. So64.6b]
MLKERRQANDIVTRDFLQAEAATDRAATQAAQCMVTMLQARQTANLPVGTGIEALRLVSEGASALVKARQSFVEAHRILADVRAEIGITGYGDSSECPPTEGTLATPHRLAAVA